VMSKTFRCFYILLASLYLRVANIRYCCQALRLDSESGPVCGYFVLVIWIIVLKRITGWRWFFIWCWYGRCFSVLEVRMGYAIDNTMLLAVSHTFDLKCGRFCGSLIIY